jgi:hypothetical protein
MLRSVEHDGRTCAARPVARPGSRMRSNFDSAGPGRAVGLGEGYVRRAATAAASNEARGTVAGYDGQATACLGPAAIYAINCRGAVCANSDLAEADAPLMRRRRWRDHLTGGPASSCRPGQLRCADGSARMSAHTERIEVITNGERRRRWQEGASVMPIEFDLDPSRRWAADRGALGLFNAIDRSAKAPRQQIPAEGFHTIVIRARPV